MLLLSGVESYLTRPTTKYMTMRSIQDSKASMKVESKTWRVGPYMGKEDTVDIV